MSSREQEIHEKAAVGFGRAADAYERGRPEYSDEAVEFIRERLRLFGIAHAATGGLAVADLAAGTGKFTKVLASYDPEIVASVTAIEPIAEMRAKIPSNNRIAMISEGTAEKIPFINEAFDVVTVAQAFHWFDAPKALREIHRVLRPDGLLMMIWNVRDESHAWIRRMTELMVPYEGNAPRYRSMKWREAFSVDAASEHPHFTELQFTHFQHLTYGTVETMVDRVASVSFVASLPEADRETLLGQMRELYRQHQKDNGFKGDEIAMPYETHIFTCRRR